MSQHNFEVRIDVNEEKHQVRYMICHNHFCLLDVTRNHETDDEITPTKLGREVAKLMRLLQKP